MTSTLALLRGDRASEEQDKMSLITCGYMPAVSDQARRKEGICNYALEFKCFYKR